MKNLCTTRSSVVLFVLASMASVLPAPARALQQYSHAVQGSSSAVLNRTDSTPTMVASGSAAISADSGTAPEKPVISPSGEKGTGLSGKVFARFVLPEDWISLTALPGSESHVSTASLEGGPSTETVFTMRSFGQKVRA